MRSARRLTRTLALVAGAFAAFAASAAPAVATHVSCGDTITQSTTLDSDLVNCPGDGVVIGASGITLDLAGHTIDGTGPGEGGSGVDNRAGHDGVTVEGGQIQEFTTGVWLEHADRNVVRNLRLTAMGAGVYLVRADANVVTRNTLSGPGLVVYLGSDRNVIASNSISGPGTAVAVWGGPIDTPDEVRGTRIEKNRLIGNAVGLLLIGTVVSFAHQNLVTGNADQGILAAGVGDVFEQNTVSGNGVGIWLSGADLRALRNHVSGNETDGIFVPSGAQTFGSVIERNVASENGDDGIDVNTLSATYTTTVARNVANDNADLGIEADPDVTDGGGNRARGNGNPAQCTGVVCR